MLGWCISVHRQEDGGASPATAESSRGARLAIWQAGLGGRDWLDELAKTGKAIDLGGNGYPYRYTATAEHLLKPVTEGPPGAHTSWLFGPYNILMDNWEGKTVIDHAAVAQCRPDEWLLVTAWDES